jgi:hypothetical protein
MQVVVDAGDCVWIGRFIHGRIWGAKGPLVEHGYILVRFAQSRGFSEINNLQEFAECC